DSVKFVVADLSETTFIDSMALAVLVSGLKVVRQRGGDFILASPAEAVSVILELTSIDRAFNVVGSVDEGLKLAAALSIIRRFWRPRNVSAFWKLNSNK